MHLYCFYWIWTHNPFLLLCVITRAICQTQAHSLWKNTNTVTPSLNYFNSPEDNIHKTTIASYLRSSTPSKMLSKEQVSTWGFSKGKEKMIHLFNLHNCACVCVCVCVCVYSTTDSFADWILLASSPRSWSISIWTIQEVTSRWNKTVCIQGDNQDSWAKFSYSNCLTSGPIL
jgi:hypothetical protein